ncbi:hypothetical protein [Lutibacter sp. HS1-25]|uniref:hypothetical protein n=1 Tax=Lutibacter sp. HS1-25 TaxID=2485000 RepID=UPI0010138DA9|nr:hypothetical protein [Lutibacter sp. HS1-25]
MKQLKFLLTLSFMAILSSQLKAQDSADNYIEFNDRQNVVNGVYLGLNFGYGEMDGKSTYFGGAKIAYVANRQFEVGFSGIGFYSEQNSKGLLSSNDIFGGYGGLHLEPIFFGPSKWSLSIPMLVGGGAAAYANKDLDEIIDNGYGKIEDWKPFFVFEPGISVQYNISRYFQFEMGVKYRLSSEFELYPESITNINGFTGGIGIKMGIFNMGKNS